MAPRPSPARAKILEILADGAWHDLEAVIVEAARVVPPGRAWRTAEHARTRTTSSARSRGNDDTAIATGQRAIARRAVQTLTGRAHHRRLVEIDRGRIRLVPTVGGNVDHLTPQEHR